MTKTNMLKKNPKNSRVVFLKNLKKLKKKYCKITITQKIRVIEIYSDRKEVVNQFVACLQKFRGLGPLLHNFPVGY